MRGLLTVARGQTSCRRQPKKPRRFSHVKDYVAIVAMSVQTIRQRRTSRWLVELLRDFGDQLRRKASLGKSAQGRLHVMLQDCLLANQWQDTPANGQSPRIFFGGNNDRLVNLTVSSTLKKPLKNYSCFILRRFGLFLIHLQSKIKATLGNASNSKP